MTGRRLLAVAPAVALLCASCGSPAPTNAPLVLAGAVNGVYRPGPPASCGRGATTVRGPFGPNPTTDVGELTVSDGGAVSFALSGGRTTFSGSGSAFRPKAGWDVDALLAAASGQQLRVRGHLSC